MAVTEEAILYVAEEIALGESPQLAGRAIRLAWLDGADWLMRAHVGLMGASIGLKGASIDFMSPPICFNLAQMK